jgi:hypothetical protein
LRPCDIDVERSPRFKREFKAFQEKYRQTVDDVRELFERIAQDPRGTAHARQQTGNEQQEAYKYYCRSRDLKKGSREAYRIIALYEPERNLLTPLAMYLKPNDITIKEVAAAIKALTS